MGPEGGVPPLGGSVELYRDKAGEFRWRRKAGNGEIVADSGEGYTSLDYAHQQASAEAEAFGIEVVTLHGEPPDA